MHILYETTCLVNGKKYIGVHNTHEDDGYLGSGKALLGAVKRYGKGEFTRNTLELFDTAEEAYAREAEVVTPEICKSKSHYNIIVGGCQPPNHTGRKTPSVKKTEANLKRWADPEYKSRVSKVMSENHPRKKSCVIDGVEYESQSAAARALGITRQGVRYRLTSSLPQA